MKESIKKNVVLFDSSYDEAYDFIEGLKKETEFDWEAKVCNSNKGRNFFYNIIRYIKYFIYPFYIFLNRKSYSIIIGWQEFYGLIFAFYCRLFKVKKINKVIIKNFIYKPKKGLIGKIYFCFMKYIVKSKYIDMYICASNKMVKYCCNVFDEKSEKFVFIPFGVNDFSNKIKNVEQKEYVLSIGRSNRDWNFLINSFKSLDYNLKIICDELEQCCNNKNIEILNNIYGEESFKYMSECKCMVISIDNPNIASGDTVLLQAMSFSKPIIITRPSCLADDYVKDGYNGIIIDKNLKDLENALKSIYGNKELYESLSKNARTNYIENHSLFNYGIKVGKNIINKIDLGEKND